MERRGKSDADYYRARALEEQVAAQKATCTAARERHDELATMYRFRAVMLTKHKKAMRKMKLMPIGTTSPGSERPTNITAMTPNNSAAIAL